MVASGPLRLSFVMSATRGGDLPPTAVEVAFVGRSNVGKSALVNALANRKQLARVSNTPGRTQSINLFAVDGAASDGRTGTMVDLPGYGYAKAPRAVKRDWPEMIEGYLLDRDGLAMVYVLVDGPIGPTRLDEQVLEWLSEHGVPHTVVATKADKVKPSRRATRRRELAAGCRLDPDDVVWVSSATGEGIDRLRSMVRDWIAR